MRDIIIQSQASINNFNEQTASEDEFFTEKLRENREMLYKMAFIYMKNEQEALDVVSETVYKCYKNFNKLKNPEYFGTWAARILINNCMTALKKKGKQEKYAGIEEDKDTFDISDKLMLEEALAALRPEYKTCILLRYYRDLNLKETARIMKLPQNTVKTYTRRALERLRSILKEEDFFE